MGTQEELERLIPHWYKAVLDWNDAVQRRSPEDEKRRLQQVCRKESMALTDAELERLSGGDQEKQQAMRQYCQAVQRDEPEEEQQRLLNSILSDSG